MGTAFKISPKDLFSGWGYFESWSAGDAVAPDGGWVLSGAGAAVAKESTIKKFGLYSCKLSLTSATVNLNVSLVDRERDIAWWQGRTVSFGFWVYATVASRARVLLSDGVTSHYSSYHTGGSGWEFLSSTVQLDPNANQVTLSCIVQGGVTSAYFDGGIVCEGEDLFTTFDTNIDISSWSPSLDIRSDEYEIAGREGVLVPDYNMGGKSIAVKGNIVGSDPVSCRTHLDDFLKSLLSWQKTDKRDLYLYDDRVLEVFLKSFKWDYVKSLDFVKYTMQVSVPLSVSRYMAKLRTKQVISGTITEFTIPYLGNAESLPKVKFIADQGGAISTCTLENLTTQQSLSYAGTVPTGVTLEVDCFSPTVLNSGVDKIGDFSGDFLGLVRGTNYLRFTGSNCTIDIDYYNRWIS